MLRKSPKVTSKECQRISPLQIRDTLDACNFRRLSPQIIETEDPRTPKKRKSPAKKLDPYDETFKLSFSPSPLKDVHDTTIIISGDDEFDSRSSAYFSGRSSNLFEKSLADESINMDHFSTETSAYDSDELSNESSKQSKENLEAGNYRRELPNIIVTLETTVESITKENHIFSKTGPVTSSPMTTSSIPKKFDETIDKFIEPDYLNNTLERVDFRLKACGYISPSPYRMAKRKHLMEVYVDNLLEQEAIQRKATIKSQRNDDVCKPSRIGKMLANGLNAKNRKAIKRTISVDQTLKLLS